MPDDVQQDPTQQAPGQPNPLAQLLGLVAQARSQGVPVLQAPLPQHLGDTGTPTDLPWQSIQPQQSPKTLNDFLQQPQPQQPQQSPKDDNRTATDVLRDGVESRAAFEYELRNKVKPQLDQNGNLLYDSNGNVLPKQKLGPDGKPIIGPDGKPMYQKSDYYASPAKRILSDFLMGAMNPFTIPGMLMGHDPMHNLRQEEWNTDQQVQLQQQGRDIQQQKADDINTRAQARLAAQQQLQQDRKTLSDRDYLLKRGHLKVEEDQAQQRIDLATQAEKDRVAGRAQSLAQAAMPKVMKQAMAEIQLQHKNAGDDLNDPDVQNKMNVEVARRMEELQPKQYALDAMAKMSQNGELDGVDPLDLNGNMAAVDKSKVLSAEDKSNLKSFLRLNGTPASQNQSGVNRSAAYANNRLYPALTTDTGNVVYASGQQMKENPGGFAPVSPAVKAMGQSAQFSEIRRSMTQLRSAWQNAGQIDGATRAKLLFVMSDPEGLQKLMTSGALGSLTEAQQDLVIATASANENIMALRNIAGMGQGAQDLRDAIRGILPSGTTPDSKYAMKQLDTIDQQINALDNRPQVGNSGLTEPSAPRHAPASPGSAAAVHNTTGLKDAATGQFRQFNNPEESIQASKQDIQIKTQRDPNLTLSGLADVWQGHGLPQNYSAKDLAKDLGVSPNAKVANLDPEQVARAIAKHETGYGKAPSGKIAVIDPEGKPAFIDADKWDVAEKRGYRRR
jgi:hypothetical protein